MSVRKIIEIDQEKCDGCGLCADACHEGAIQMIDGKAGLVSETYCDGLGDCIGECPRDAIRIIEREADAFDSAAVESHLARRRANADTRPPVPCSCPSAALKSFDDAPPARPSAGDAPAQLRQWPVQLMLVPPTAPFLKGADLLITADCVPFATANYHSRYLSGKVTVVGCPKLDDIELYYEKLKLMFSEAAPASITVLRMEVPCCGGMAKAVTKARNEVVPDTGLEVVTISIRGEELQVEHVPSP